MSTDVKQETTCSQSGDDVTHPAATDSTLGGRAFETSPYAEAYSDAGFWQKVLGHAKKAGREVIEKALLLYYVMQRPDVPAWAKTAIIGAIGYFIVPLDVVPDAIPFVGFADDLAVLVAALATVAGYIDADVKAQAQAKLSQWFG